ncbi:TetR/AcrR family transcriptional regulator [Metabacillus niabensis]|uniref:AcrR family transcriptional regulator n=1 Tax=Metabacillus niabensis TaxID=324854 RepID=A0ABT9Z2B2_9BACI|nr:TetR/AcrR family transcriptional regulator [Metabacillus niabensis]MDQ0226390.1 AcrR family transcriptional regulator [Metabacillus niabensis]
MDGFQRRREQKKLDILKAALSLFLEYGIQKVSISEIAKKANVSQVTIYNYFENKHTLINEVMIYFIDTAINDFQKTVTANISFPEKIKTILFNKGEIANQIHEEFYQYLMNEYTTEGNYIEEIYVKKTIPLFTDLIKEGKEQGYVDPNTSDEAIMFYIKMLKEYIQRDDVYSKVLPLTEDITKIFFYGIMGQNIKE